VVLESVGNRLALQERERGPWNPIFSLTKISVSANGGPSEKGVRENSLDKKEGVVLKDYMFETHQ
jgi:hypothetical protein